VGCRVAGGSSDGERADGGGGSAGSAKKARGCTCWPGNRAGNKKTKKRGTQAGGGSGCGASRRPRLRGAGRKAHVDSGTVGQRAGPGPGRRARGLGPAGDSAHARGIVVRVGATRGLGASGPFRTGRGARGQHAAIHASFIEDREGEATRFQVGWGRGVGGFVSAREALTANYVRGNTSTHETEAGCAMSRADPKHRAHSGVALLRGHTGLKACPTTPHRRFGAARCYQIVAATIARPRDRGPTGPRCGLARAAEVGPSRSGFCRCAEERPAGTLVSGWGAAGTGHRRRGLRQPGPKGRAGSSDQPGEKYVASISGLGGSLRGPVGKIGKARGVAPGPRAGPRSRMGSSINLHPQFHGTADFQGRLFSATCCTPASSASSQREASGSRSFP